MEWKIKQYNVKIQEKRGKEMDKKKREEPTIAPGNEELLEKKASREDIKNGNYTRVTALSYDEVNPS